MPSLDLPSSKLCYDDVGDGPAVLLLQGVGVSRVAWRPQIDALGPRHRCLAIDHRGVGGSEGDLARLSVATMATDALDALDALDVARVHVVGHSLGGVVATAIALRAPDRVASLSLLCTFAGGRDLSRPTARLVWLGARTRIGTRGMRRAAFAELVSAPARVASRGVESVAAQLEAAFGRSLVEPPPVADAQLAALRAHDERERLGELAGVPTLVASAEHDPIAPPRCGEGIAAAIPGARYELFAGESHAVTIQHADAVNALLARHVERAAG